MPDERRTQHVTLGCGTLILIALIVLVFSGHGHTDLERDLKALRTEVADLKGLMGSQTNEIKLLQKKIDRLPGVKE